MLYLPIANNNVEIWSQDWAGGGEDKKNVTQGKPVTFTFLYAEDLFDLFVLETKGNTDWPSHTYTERLRVPRLMTMIVGKHPKTAFFISFGVS